MEEIEAPGLKWIQRKASRTPIWVASVKDFKPRTVNLAHLRDQPEVLYAKCALLQAEMNTWKTGMRTTTDPGDTIGSLLRKYQTEEDSPYFTLRHRSRQSYDYYIPKLISIIGDRRIDKITGVDLKRWHEGWSDGGRLLATSKMMRSVIDAAITYGVMCRMTSCIELRETLKAASRKLPSPKRREVVITADQIIALRAAAHADGRPSSALTYALVFETTLRLWDVIGQWVPVDEDGISDVINPRTGKKWFGLRWEDIDADLIARYVPSKTSMKTGLAVTYPLKRAPMVVEELALYGGRRSDGPVITYEKNGRPYLNQVFSSAFSRDRKAAGLPKSFWARDLRASGISEARALGVATDDAAKVAGHSSTRTTSEVYDRAALEAAERFADARSVGRKSKL